MLKHRSPQSPFLLDWMLAIDFLDPAFLRLASRKERSRRSSSHPIQPRKFKRSFYDLFEDLIVLAVPDLSWLH